MKIYIKRSILLAICIISLISVACEGHKDNATNDKIGEQTSNLYENRWIYEQLKKWYLWESEMPYYSGANIDNEEFFDFLLYRKGKIDGDRFSHMEENADYKAPTRVAAKFQEIGTGIIATPYLITINSVERIVFSVVHVFADSPNFGNVNRGDIIWKVNSEFISRDNYLTLIQTKEPIIVGFCGVSNNTVYDGRKISLKVGAYTKNPVLECKVLDVEGRKVGYLAYSEFEKDSESELNDAFLKMRNEGATELVLDLRYNPGGYVDVAIHLGSLMVPKERLGETYLKMIYNRALNNSSYPKTEATSTDAQVLNCKLELTRLFVLTAQGTASASETTIHCMKPFLNNNVITIGDVTVGKNQAAVELKDPDHKWILWPIFSYVTDKNDQKFSVTGIVPDYKTHEYLDDMKALGDPTDLLLAAALQKITTGSFPPVVNPTKTKANNAIEIKGVLLDKNQRNGNICTPKSLKN